MERDNLKRAFKKLNRVMKRVEREEKIRSFRERRQRTNAAKAISKFQRIVRERVNPVQTAKVHILWNVYVKETGENVGDGRQFETIEGRKNEIEAIAEEVYNRIVGEIEQSPKNDLVYRGFSPMKLERFGTEPTHTVDFGDQIVRGVNTLHTTDICDANVTARCCDDWIIKHCSSKKDRHTYERIDAACGTVGDTFVGRKVTDVCNYMRASGIAYRMYDAFGDLQMSFSDDKTRRSRKPMLSAIISQGHVFPITAINQRELSHTARVQINQPTKYANTDTIIDTNCLKGHVMDIMIGNYDKMRSEQYVKCMPILVYGGKSLKEIRYTDENGDHTMRANPMYGMAPPSIIQDVYETVGLSDALINTPSKSLVTLLAEKAGITRETYQSYMSNEIFNTICMKGGEIWANMYEKRKYATFDMNGCRRNILMTHEFPRFMLGDECRSFTGKIRTNAMYQIEAVCDKAQDFFNYGHHWYCGVEVEFAYEMGYRFNITREVVASDKVSAGHFTPLWEQAHALCEVDNMPKTIMNAFIGQMVRPREYTTYEYTTNEQDAHYRAAKIGAKHCSIILKNDTETLMCIGRTHKREHYRTCWPIYAFVLAIERVNCYKLAAQVGKPLVAMHTDSVTFEGDVDLPTTQWANGIPMWKREAKAVKQIQKNCYNQPMWENLVKPWNIVSDPGHNDFEGLVDGLVKGAHISAPAGCGKTHLLRLLVQRLQREKQRFIVMAPTHSACNVLRKGIDVDVSVCAHYEYVYSATNNRKARIPRYAIVDEASMCSHSTLMMLTKLRHSGCILIMSGDYSQLEAVDNVGAITHNQNAHLRYLCGGVMVSLNICRRSDTVLFDACMDVRAGKQIDVSVFPPAVCDRAVCYRNETRKAVNNEIVSRLFKDTVCVDGWLLADGMRLIGRKNTKTVKNGLEYVLSDMSDGKYSVAMDGKKIGTWNAAGFIEMFNPGYCTTIHAAQGVSINEHYAIFEWDRFAYKHRKALRYVALSRGTQAEFVHIM